jgi:hypothetical protein
LLNECCGIRAFDEVFLLGDLFILFVNALLVVLLDFPFCLLVLHDILLCPLSIVVGSLLAPGRSPRSTCVQRLEVQVHTVAPGTALEHQEGKDEGSDGRGHESVSQATRFLLEMP